MPQYLAPGVYVEELPGPRTIAGVSTSTAAFVGPTRFGPVTGRPQLLTSYLDFARIYGDAVDLEFADNNGATVANHLALGVKGFFDEGGSSLYVVRAFNYTAAGTPEDDHATGATTNGGIQLVARFPGAAGNMVVTFTLKVGQNVLAGSVLTRVHEYDLVWAVGGAHEGARVVRRDTGTGALYLAGGAAHDLDGATAVLPLTVVVDVRRPTVNSQGLRAFGAPEGIGEFGFDPRAVGTGISTVLTRTPLTSSQELTVPIALDGVDALTVDDNLPVTIANALLGSSVIAKAPVPNTPVGDLQVSVTLSGGSDGNRPDENAYEGRVDLVDWQDNPTRNQLNGLLAITGLDDVSIVAAPGAASGWYPDGTAGGTVSAAVQEINAKIITHCENSPYLVAAIDTPAHLLPNGALDFRNLRSSEHAALYYPWVTVSHPLTGNRIDVPPAAYAAGIWARTDAVRGVIKAPANEVVRSALDLETRLNKPQQELLNPEGVNCLRFFPGPGFLVWGARTISDDPEWKYLSIRRYFNYLEKSIDEGTQWVVFEVNGPALWDAVRHTIEGFLLNEWRSGALLGAKPEEGFFVRCDASTMTPDDLDNGRLVCVIGVAAAKPAEFVIFRISQITAPTSS